MRGAAVSLLMFLLCASSAVAMGGNPRACLVAAADRFDVPLVVFATVMRTEACWNGFEKRNANGTHDLGLMCINSVHLVALGLAGVTREALRDDACTSIVVAGYLLAGHFARARSQLPAAVSESPESATNRWWATAIGWYHSRTPQLAARYRGRARENLVELTRAMVP